LVKSMASTNVRLKYFLLSEGIVLAFSPHLALA
jgi:hypothetical protein